MIIALVFLLVIAGGVFLLSRDKDDKKTLPIEEGRGWSIGPIIDGENSSKGVPSTPSPYPGALFCIDLPNPTANDGHVHYVTFGHGPLAGKSRIVMRYRIEMSDSTKICPRNYPESPSVLSLYFQRKGDDWSARGAYEAYRWYSSFRFHSPIEAGEHELSVSLDENWTAVLTSSAETNPAGFKAAKDNAYRVGFVLGGGDGFGHGVFATGPSKLIVTEFSVI